MGEREDAPREPFFCDFCGKHESFVELIVTGRHGAAICDECIENAADIVAERRAKPA